MKKLLSHILAIFIGVFTFVAYALNYITAFVKYNGEYQMKDEMGKITGYELIDFELFEGKFSGVMLGIFHILVLVAAVVLVAYGVLGLLKELGVLNNESSLAKVVKARWSVLGLIVYAALNVFVIIFAISWCGTTVTEFGNSSTGLKVMFGLFLPLILSVLSVAGSIAGEKLLK